MAKNKMRIGRGEWGWFGQSKKSKAREAKYGTTKKDAQETAKKEGLEGSLTTSLGDLQSSAKEMLAPGGYFQQQQDTALLQQGTSFRDKSMQNTQESNQMMSKSGFSGQTNALQDYKEQQNIQSSNLQRNKTLQESGKQRTEYLTGLQTQAQGMLTSYMGATDEAYDSGEWDSFMSQYT